MPLASMNCTGCGSNDVQEVKADTYFCNHCETVFKHIDPSRVTVAEKPNFCGCGNSVKAQCQLCQSKMMCDRCDVIHLARVAKVNVEMATVGWGFTGDISTLFPKWARHYYSFGYSYTYQLATVSDGCVQYHHRDHDLTAGPRLLLHQLLSTLETQHGGFYHLCLECAASAVFKTVERFADAATCYWPTCLNLHGGQCGCCGRVFGIEHTSAWESKLAVFAYVYGPRGAGWQPGFQLGGTFPAGWTTPEERRLCGPCCWEHGSRLRDIREEFFSAEVSKSEKDGALRKWTQDDVFEVWADLRKPRWMFQEGENEKARSTAERLAREFSQRLEERMLSTTCHRGADSVSVLDDRAATVPAVAPGVLAAS
jgi:hypothetical protein